MTFIQRGINVDAMSWHSFLQCHINVDATPLRLYDVPCTSMQRNDVNVTSCKRHMPAGL